MKGDVVILAFPFADLSGAKRRPALVVARAGGNDLLLCPVTRRRARDRYDVPLGPGHFVEGGLPSSGHVRSSHLFTAESRIISYRAGRVSDEYVGEVASRIISMLRAS